MLAHWTFGNGIRYVQLLSDREFGAMQDDIQQDIRIKINITNTTTTTANCFIINDRVSVNFSYFAINILNVD